MPRYIDADKLKEVSFVMEYKDEWHMTQYGMFVELADIENAPTADVVERDHEITYMDCANAMMKMWIDKVLTDGEYNRIMGRLNAHEAKREGRDDGEVH